MTQPDTQPASSSSTTSSDIQSTGSSPTAQPDTQPASSSSTSIDFGRDFHLFPRFDEYVFNHWYIYLIGFEVIFLTEYLVWDIRHGLLIANDGLFFFKNAFYYPSGVCDFSYAWHYNYSMTACGLTNWAIALLWLGTFLTIFLFRRWMNTIPATFRFVFSKRDVSSVTPDSDVTQEYQRFLGEYRQALLSNKRYILIGVLLAVFLTVLLLWWITWGIPDFIFYATSDPLLLSIERVDLFIQEGLVILLLVYFSGAGAWMMGITGLYIKKLTTKFDLVIQPSHSDRSGGLRPLGNFCLNMALPLLTGSVLLSLYSIGNVLHVISFWTGTANVVLVAMVLPLAFLAFFLPLWNIHLKMLDKKRMYEDEFSDYITKLEEKIHFSLGKGDLEEAKRAKEEIEFVQVLHPNKISYPVWPFDRGILLKFLTPQIVPVLTLVVQLAPVIDALRKIFHSS